MSMAHFYDSLSESEYKLWHELCQLWPGCTVNSALIDTPRGAQRAVTRAYEQYIRDQRDHDRQQWRGHSQHLSRINQTWLRQRRQRPVVYPVTSLEFWVLWFRWWAERWCQLPVCDVYRISWLWGQLLVQSNQPAVVALARLYVKALQKTLPYWHPEMSAETGRDMLWSWQRDIFPSMRWQFPWTRHQFSHISCKRST